MGSQPCSSLLATREPPLNHPGIRAVSSSQWPTSTPPATDLGLKTRFILAALGKSEQRQAARAAARTSDHRRTSFARPGEGGYGGTPRW